MGQTETIRALAHAHPTRNVIYFTLFCAAVAVVVAVTIAIVAIVAIIAIALVVLRASGLVALDDFFSGLKVKKTSHIAKSA